MAEESAKLRIPYIAASQAQKHVTHNEAMTLLDTLVQLSVKDKDLTAPPGSPAEGDCYIVAGAGGTATGAWAGWEKRVARFIDGEWRSYLPGAGSGAGWLAWVMDEDAMYRFDGTAWALAGIVGPAGPAGPAGPTGPAGPAGASALTICRAKTTANVNLAGGGLANGTTHDGVTLNTGDRVLVTAQTAAAENGVYIVPASGAASRDAAFDTYDEHPGVYFSVMEGAANADTLWRCTSNRGGALGTDPLVFSQFTSGGGGASGAARNALINGGFRIWQRKTDDTAVTTTRKYVADRFAMKTGAGTLAHVRQTTSVRTGARSPFALELVGATGVTTVDVDQRIEALNVPSGTVTFSAYVYNGSGASFTPTLFVSTPSASDNWTSSTVRNGGGSGESLQPCPDGAWTRVTWSADISGYTNIGNGVEFRLRVPSGSLDSGTKTVRLAEVQVEDGAAATDFERRPMTYEVALCQRYYQKSYALGTAPGTAVGAGSNGLVWGAVNNIFTAAFILPFEMVRTPTATIYDGAGTSGKTSYFNGTSWNNGQNAGSVTVTAKSLNIAANGPPTTSFVGYDYTLDAEL